MATTSTLRELWDTTRMRLLVEIERQGSVSAAAAAIGIGQPGATVAVEVAASGEILKRLLAGRVQLALVGASEADERIELEPFLEDEIVGVAKAGAAPITKGVLAPARLSEFMLLSRERGSSS